MSNRDVVDPFAFLGSRSEMGRYIRSFDWAASPLEELAKWPMPLRFATAMILQSQIPTALLWGTQGILVYNDGYQAFAGLRHPQILGTSILEAWPEAHAFNRHVLDLVLAGDTLSYRDQHMVLLHNGEPADMWLDIDYSPVLDEAGTPAGVLAMLRETTERVRAEQRLRIAQDVGGVGSFEWFPQSGRIEASDQYRRIWGLPADGDVNDALIRELVHPDDRHALAADRVEHANPIAYAEYRRVDPNTGEVRWIARRGEVLEDDMAGPRYIGIAMDITERKRAEELIAESESRWRGLFEQMQEAFFIGRPVRDATGKMIDFVLLEVNPAFGTQTGLDVSNVIGKTARAVVPTIRDSLLETYHQLMETGEPVAFEIHTTVFGNRWFEARARKLDDDRFAVLFLDISARVQAANALRENEARFRVLAQSMPSQVWTADRYGLLDWFNDRAYEYAGSEAGSLDASGWMDVVHPDDLEKVAQSWKAAVRNGERYETDLRLRRHDGIYRWFIARALPVRDHDGAIERWIGNNADIEDQKTIEAAVTELAVSLEQRVQQRTAELLKTQDALRQSQKMESIGNLTGGIAHDFNNLLQVISGNLQLISDDVGDNPRTAQHIENAMAGVGRGAKLTSQLLAFGRRQPLMPRVVNAARLIRNMDDLLRRSIGEEIELETIIAGGLWHTLIDPGNLENALLNLAINARDAMNGRGRLTIEAGNAMLDDNYVLANPDTRAGQYVLVAVTDTGSGIAPELIDQVIEPFFTTKPEGRGTGLGLSMVYGFVKQSQGHIKMYSEVGHGTTVKLYLPRSTQNEDDVTDIASLPSTGGNECILIAEDDDAVRETVVSLLSNLGYRVLQARDAQSALDIIHSGIAVDLLFTDVVMPGTLRSPELARQARILQPTIAVLFTSGYTENAIVHGGRLDDGVALLSKPYTNQALARKIRQVLNAQQNINASLQATRPRAKGSATSLCILLCEDDELIRTIVAEALRAKGHDVIEAANATQAMALSRDRSVDLLLADVGLPDISGVELARLLRQQRVDLPVIYATGKFDEQSIPNDARSATLLKPYGIEQLLQKIEQLLA